MSASPTRIGGIDAARGLLLVAMVGVHVVSGYGSASQVNGLHRWFGIFLISAGFVGLSGYVAAAKPGVPGAGMWGRAVESCFRLLLVMLGYGILLSLLRHGLALASGGAEGCAARFGWAPPTRFDDLGILLPIALTQLFAPLARMARSGAVGAAAGSKSRALATAVVAALVLLALGWELLPEIFRRVPGGAVVDLLRGALVERRWTPFYTASSFVAVGIAGALLARFPWHAIRDPAGSSLAGTFAARVLPLALSIPPVSAAILDPTYTFGGQVGGGAATLVYWTGVIALFIRGYAVPLDPDARSRIRETLALLGRHSLFAFVLHDVLLEVNTFLRAVTGLPKGAWTVAAFLTLDLVLLILACRAVERSRKARALAVAGLLERGRRDDSPAESPAPAAGLLERARRDETSTESQAPEAPGWAARAARPQGVFSVAGGLGLAVVLASYTGGGMARPADVLVIDDFQQEDCPKWWTFGALSFSRAPRDPDSGDMFLKVRGTAPGMFAHGRGLYLTRDVGDLQTLELDVGGAGPGSGRMKIELSEDDNGNWEIEKDPRIYVPLHDDRLVYELSVDWHGWRRISLPVSAFRDDNPAGGNNVWDPRRDLTSGGLLELQVLFSPSTAGAGDRIHIDLDDIRWTP